MLSALQKYILKELYQVRRAAPSQFLIFYSRKRNTAIPSHADQHTIVVRSVERLVERGLLIAKGKKTKEKWFISEVQLTPEGKKCAKEVIQNNQLSFYPSKR